MLVLLHKVTMLPLTRRTWQGEKHVHIQFGRWVHRKKQWPLKQAHPDNSLTHLGEGNFSERSQPLPGMSLAFKGERIPPAAAAVLKGKEIQIQGQQQQSKTVIPVIPH